MVVPDEDGMLGNLRHHCASKAMAAVPRKNRTPCTAAAREDRDKLDFAFVPLRFRTTSWFSERVAQSGVSLGSSALTEQVISRNAIMLALHLYLFFTANNSSSWIKIGWLAGWLASYRNAAGLGDDSPIPAAVKSFLGFAAGPQYRISSGWRFAYLILMNEITIAALLDAPGYSKRFSSNSFFIFRNDSGSYYIRTTPEKQQY